MMVHTTTGEWKTHVRRHRPIADACLRCHFPVEAPRPQEGCARGDLPADATPPDSDDEPDAALPFVSMLAGALLAGELVKLTLENYPYTPNSVEVGMKSPFSFPANWPQRDDCGFCQHVDEGLYRSIIQETKFAALSSQSSTR